jgi:hypothetical protein
MAGYRRCMDLGDGLPIAENNWLEMFKETENGSLWLRALDTKWWLLGVC